MAEDRCDGAPGPWASYGVPAMTARDSSSPAPTGETAHRPRRHASSAELVDSFDAFYKEARDRLLLQTFALTGDLAVARSSVRESFVVVWHHWRKTSRLADPEMTARPIAWRKALRRNSARPWHRRKEIDPESKAILDALGALPVSQRKALLLTQLAAVTMDEMAHEIGLPLEAAERELQLGAAQFATQLEIPTSGIPLALSSLGNASSAIWPRVTIIRRAGAARRRAHTVIGSAAAVVALVAGGAVATDATGSRPTLDRTDVPGASTPAAPGTASTTLPDSALLSVESVADHLPGRRWTQVATSDNSTGDGRVLPCQRDRYADPRGTAAWVRTFRNGADAKARPTFTQFAEASLDGERSLRTYVDTLRWFTACVPPRGDGAMPFRVQLVSTATLTGVGDQAVVLVLRSRADRTTHVVGVARTGMFTTVTAMGTDAAIGKVRRGGVARLLTDAVDRLCQLDGGGACSTDDPLVADRPAYPIGATPWLLSEVDLPPLSKDQGPWVGTPPAALTEDRVDSGAIGCETVHLFRSFRNRAIQGNQFRTFVLSEADLPPEVGLTQTVGALPGGAAAAFVARVREQMTACPDQDATAGTEVTELQTTGRGDKALSAWHLTTALPGDRSVEYDVAVVRNGTSVSLLVYVAAPRARIADGDFVALARRAQDRLRTMAPYGRN